MRVVLISQEYPPPDNAGGIGTNTAITARALARRGHAVCVVTGGEGQPVDDAGVRVVHVRHRWLPRQGAERLLSARRKAAAARHFRPEIVQAAEWEAEAWWLARFGRIPIVTRLATPTYLVEELNGRPPDPATALLRRLERDQASHSAAVFAPTRAIAERVGGDWDLRGVEIIPNPLDLDEVREFAEHPPGRELPARTLVFFGRMERRKGVETLAAALPAVLEAHENLHALFIGRDAGDEGGELMRRFWSAVERVRDRVHVLGALPRPETMAIVARAELVVVPSLWESFGYVCVEAMALGRPVVASRAGGLAEIVRDGESGWLVPPGDSQALAEKLRVVLARPDELERVARAGEARAADFSVDRVVERIEELYERVARGEHITDEIYRRGYRRHFRPDERGPFRRLYAGKREAVLGHFSSAQRLRIADVGGGYGRIAGPLASRHDMTLVDISPEMLEEARRRWPGLSTLEADARSLPLADGELDAVIALDLTPHLPDLHGGLAELARVVRSGGEVVVDTSSTSPWWVLGYPAYVNWQPKRLLLTMRARGVLPEWRGVVRHHGPDEARLALAAAGLRIEREQRFGPPWSAKWHLWWTRKE
ncbi:MAG: glycosyltransferase [Gaiellaceae bacterium]